MSKADSSFFSKFSLMPGSITRFFLLLVIMLLIAMGVLVQSAVTGWLKNKSYQVADISHLLEKRIETWRYTTWQIYDNIAAAQGSDQNNGLQETRLRQDVYYLEKPRRKTEALIFGSHDSDTLEMAQRISGYLDALWGAENIPWSMYYLNGQDNSMIMISTLPLKDLTAGFKESGVENMVDLRRAEMLQQANVLDERESFSALRQSSWQNSYYFTLRTTFNQPGHLATVVAFDLPVNDLIAPDMPLNSIRLDPVASGERKSTGSVTVSFNGTRIDIASPVNNSQLRLVWQVPTGMLLSQSLQSIALPLLLNILLLMMAMYGYIRFRHPQARPVATPVAPGQGELQTLRALNEEIVAQLPLGLLVHDLDANRTVISNKIADHLLPHLNLQNIASLADQHQGVIQATINNELYEIRQYRSQIAPRTQIFVIRDQDKEVLVNKKLKQAQRLYEKNQAGRASFMEHIGEALKAPTLRLANQASQLSGESGSALVSTAENIIRLVQEIQLLNALEADAWEGEVQRFTLQALVDEVVPEVLPAIRRKGLQLLVNNHLAAGAARHGDREALRTILLMLIHYALVTTRIGKITLEIDQDASSPERLTFRIIDTGNGINNDEIDNLHFPFFSPTSSDEQQQANGLTFYLCNQLARKLGGHLNIKSRDQLGTRYTLHVNMPVEAPQAEEETGDEQEKLLDDVIAMVDVTANEVRHIVTRLLESWGASCITPDERLASQEFDVFLTDNPSNLTASGVLLSDDEPGMRKIGEGKFCANFNISSAVQEAVLQLIEAQLSEDIQVETVSGSDESTQLHASGYYALFADTVPEDVGRLYNEAASSDHAALAQTAHRLKGVFAMLNLHPGKQLCETLEQHIREKDAPAIEKYISDIDGYVKRLL
ncbi:phosphotransferase RcsD [Shimwellia blattae]|uniref:Phosphotransferase RcsD n=1 Tax=Shimwellia blattae (strain ATCC 29907 / DSM 4481 / JCM 1650 / NBRC 105725 / CDC 9005-74) TaxID=630626 RepID=I2B7A8_SHIBC|nr:phosphotransferase RcsD [Shimwellia blattae]AFJ46412.1 putative sensor-like histidine kinase YojN [Shimwellia blattae DSM 4481 = NBRC 105725]GAB79993.1 sensor-like histidine kinase RcsD [Shimwellia blattae DSM 4481 = NBRC 105725]VDY63879.1 Sensor-like histidine kinase RcsD [Shimwellia blattae]VEC22016.1 Sensor-like histidine kinase RcsD [Shimwellia blattae]